MRAFLYFLGHTFGKFWQLFWPMLSMYRLVTSLSFLWDRFLKLVNFVKGTGRLPAPMDDAPEVSDEYSFLLESSVLDRDDGSQASPERDAYLHFAVSKLSKVPRVWRHAV